AEPGMQPPSTETWISAPRQASAASAAACLVHIYPTGAAMGGRHPLESPTVVLGRGEDCDIQLQDHSVSRRHAQIQRSATGYLVNDLQSTNGTFINDRPVTSATMQDGDYL